MPITPSGGAHHCTWQDSATCVGEIDLGRIPAYVGREHRRAQASCVSSQREGDLRKLLRNAQTLRAM